MQGGRNKFTLQALAIANYRAGEFEQTVAILQEAIKEHHGVKSNLAFLLALAHDRLGQESNCREWYQAGLQSWNQVRPKDSNDPAPWALSHWLNVSVWYREAQRELDFERTEPKPTENDASSNKFVALIAPQLAPKLIGPKWKSQMASQLNNLAWRIARFPDATVSEAQEAVELATKAVQLQPSSGSWWHTLGVARYRAGDWKGALDAWQKSCERQGSATSWHWFFRAMVHWRLENKAKALEFYDKALSWMEKNAPDNEELIRFRAEAEALLGVGKKKQ